MAEFFPEVSNRDLVAAYRALPEIHAEVERSVPLTQLAQLRGSDGDKSRG